MAEGRARVGDFFFEFTLGRGQRARPTASAYQRAATGGAFVYAGKDGELQTVGGVNTTGETFAEGSGDENHDDCVTNEAEGEGEEYDCEDEEGVDGVADLPEGEVRVTDRGVVVGNVILEGTGVWLNTRGKDSNAKVGPEEVEDTSEPLPVTGRGGTGSEKGVESKVAAVSVENPSSSVLPISTESVRFTTSAIASSSAGTTTISTTADASGSAIIAIPTTSASSATPTTATIGAVEASSPASPSPSPNAVSLRDLRAGWLAKNIIGRDTLHYPPHTTSHFPITHTSYRNPHLLL